MFKPYYFKSLEEAKKAGYTIVPFADVESFVNFCKSEGYFVCGGAFIDGGQVIYL